MPNNNKAKEDSFKDKKSSCKGKGKYFRKPNREEHEMKPSGNRVPKNDPQFYTRYRELAENAARIAFNHRNGASVSYQYGNTSADKNIDPILILQYVPNPGRSVSKQSGINIAAQATYKMLNRKYRGSPSSRYQASDLGIAQFAIMDFFLSLAQAERVYGLCQYALVNQLQLPAELLFSLGYDGYEISANLANFRANLNALIIRAQTLCLIKGYPFMEHHLFLLTNVFKDKDTPRAQYFAYKKPGYWKWNPTKFNSGSCVEWVPNQESKCWKWITGPATFVGLQTSKDIIDNLSNQLDVLLDDSDIDAICADILAFFDNSGTENLMRISMVPEGYVVQAIFDQNALYQLHNTIIPYQGSFSSTRAFPTALTDVNRNMATPYPTSILPSGETGSNHTGLFIYQESDTIRFQVNCATTGLTQVTEGTFKVYGSTSNNGKQIIKPLVDIDKLTPSTDDVIEITRNLTLWETRSVVESGTTYYVNELTTSGTVLISGVVCYCFSQVGKWSYDNNGDYEYPIYSIDAAILATIATAYPAVLTKFDWAPILAMTTNIMADLDNYRSMTKDEIAPVHEAANLSEFHNPVADVLIKDI